MLPQLQRPCAHRATRHQEADSARSIAPWALTEEVRVPASNRSLDFGLNSKKQMHWENGMIRALFSFAVSALVIVFAFDAPAWAQKVTETAQDSEPDRIRGQISEVEPSSIVLETRDGLAMRLAISDDLSIFSLTKASFTDVDFGVYVGAVSRRLDAYSPIVRDSLSWLHQGFELRIIDEELRGIAVGHTSWDLTPESVMSHGWVDDLEIRVLSIKYGPTEEEETDVDIPRDVPILKMSLGDNSLIRPGAHVFAGAQKDEDGDYSAIFLMIGEEGVVPPL